jgi:hypothetical protein
MEQHVKLSQPENVYLQNTQQKTWMSKRKWYANC